MVDLPILPLKAKFIEIVFDKLDNKEDWVNVLNDWDIGINENVCKFENISIKLTVPWLVPLLILLYTVTIILLPANG